MNYDNKNFILAIVLSMLIIFGWQYFYAAPLQEKLVAEQAQTTAPAQPSAGGAVPGSTAQTGPVNRDQALAASPRLKIETEYVSGSVNLQGGQIDDLHLLRYRETIDPKSPTITFLSPHGTPGALFAEQGFVPATGTLAKLPDSRTVWSAPQGAVLSRKQSRHAHLGQWRGAGLLPQGGDLRPVPFHRHADGREQVTGAGGPHSLCPAAAPGHAGGCRLLGVLRGHAGLARRQPAGNPLFGRGRADRAAADRHHRRLAGLHRQVLGGGHRARSVEARDRQLHPHQVRQPRRLPDGLPRQGSARRPARRLGILPQPALRRRQGGAHHQRDRDQARHRGPQLHDRLGLVLFPDQALLLPARLAQRHRRQLRRGHSAGDRAGQAGGLPARQQVLCLDEQDEEAPARDGEAQGRVSGRPDEAAAGDDGALQAREGLAARPAAFRSSCRSPSSSRSTR